MSSTARHRPRQQARSIQSVASSTADKKSITSTKVNSKPPSLSRRLLFPHLSPDADLPPLLLSPSASPELNAELYDFLAIALRAHVNPWWTKITRYDKEFLPQITHVITSVLRTLETRLISTDFSPLVFRDLPTLLNQHYVDYRIAQSKLHTSYASGGAANLAQLFHQMQPHMAVTADGRVDEAYLRQAVDHILKSLLPDEDYEPEAERYIIREIIVKVLLSVVPRLTQPWFIHKTILDLMGPDTKRVNSPKLPDAASEARPSLERKASYHLSFQSLAIHFLSAIRSISSVCLALLHAYKQALDTIKKVNQSTGVYTHQAPPLVGSESQSSSDESHISTPSKSLLPGTLVPPTPMTPAMAPPALGSKESQDSSRTSSTFSVPTLSSTSPAAPPPPPNYTHPSLHLLLTLLSSPPPEPATSSTRHSYSTSIAFTYVVSMIVTLLSPFLSRLLPYLLYTHALSPSSLANIVKNARRALFPEGWPAPSPIDPTSEEQVELRKELEQRLLDFTPGIFKPLLGPTSEAREYTVSSMLDPLSSQPCNAHLFVMILDLVIVTVFPEMGVKDQVTTISSIGDTDRGDITPPRPSSRPSSVLGK